MATAILPEVIETAIEQASKDYEAFWMGLEKQEQELTRLLCCADSYDAIVIDGDDVWELALDSQTRFTAFCLGKVSELVLYVHEDFYPDCDLEELQRELSHEVNGTGIEVELGRDSRGRSGADWLTENSYIESIIESALENC